MFRVVEAKSGSLREVVNTTVAAAAKEGLRPFAYFYSDRCRPCRAVRDSLQDPMMVDAFEGTYILKLSTDAWGLSGRAIGFVFKAIPTFFRLDPDGRPVDRIDGRAWGEDTPANMAPPLKKFLRQDGDAMRRGLLSQFASWFKKNSTGNRDYHGKTVAQWVAEYRNLAERDETLQKRGRKLEGVTDAQEAMIQVFCDIGPPAVPLLTSLARVSNWRVRCWGIKALGALGPLASGSVPVLVKSLERRGWFFRPWDPQGWAFGATLTALGRIRDPKAIQALQKALRTKKGFASKISSVALARIGTPESLNALTEALLDPNLDSTARLDVVKALSQEYPDAAAARAALNRVPSDTDEIVLQAVAEGIKAIKKDLPGPGPPSGSA